MIHTQFIASVPVPVRVMLDADAIVTVTVLAGVLVSMPKQASVVVLVKAGTILLTVAVPPVREVLPVIIEGVEIGTGLQVVPVWQLTKRVARSRVVACGDASDILMCEVTEFPANDISGMMPALPPSATEFPAPVMRAILPELARSVMESARSVADDAVPENSI